MKNIIAVVFSLLLIGCLNTNNVNRGEGGLNNENEVVSTENSKQSKAILPIEIVVKKDIPIRHYFKWMDSLAEDHNRKSNYAIDDYIIVRSNPWILDSLAHTDYYYLKEKGIFNEDSQSLIVLNKGQKLLLPDSMQTQKIRKDIANTYLDLNIPEFTLRIIENGKEKFKFLVRVGQNKKQYLAMAKGVVDLRTRPGIGKIVRVNKTPVFINPKNNHRYYVTKRDDNLITKLPAIPWLEPEIDGQRFGQLIHPTTNMSTLGKAYSNGCIGLRESDAWFVYYYAPVGTKIVFRYDLKGKDSEGKDTTFTNIYPGFESKAYSNDTVAERLKTIDEKPIYICDCRGLKQQ